MNRAGFIIILFLSIIKGEVLAQEKSFSTIQEVLTYHLNELKGSIGRYDRIFMVTSIEDQAVFPDKVYQVENSLNPKFLKKGNHYFLVKLVFYTGTNHAKIDAVNYRIIKESNKRLRLLNLSNGNTYVINSN
jgi:hypothetical protein